MLHALVTLISVFQVGIGHRLLDIQSNIAAEVCLLVRPPVHLRACLHIHGSSDEDKVLIFNFTDRFVPQHIHHKNTHDLTVDSLDSLLVENDLL